ncbi:MAG TPA: transposase [Candidatus Avisuccinivibrio pullicola]|nr:transposase [Candidatus Avisuccinivibrio pullicola]
MYLKTSVAVPVAPGKIIFREKAASTYVYFETGRHYDPERKFNVPDRVIIGKLVDKDDKTRMLPRDGYFQQHFPSVSIDETEPARVRSSTLRAGTYIVFKQIVREYGLNEILTEIFGDKSGLILDLACFMIVEKDNAGQYYPDYARCHPLFTPAMHVYSDSSITRILGEVTESQIVSFLDKWNEKQDHRQRIYISYDSTNKNSRGDLDFAEFGHAKIDQGIPIINISLAFDKTNRVPLFYEEYPGSVNDISMLQYLAEKVLTYGYRNIGLILDRGYCSHDNINYMDEKQISFLLMLKGNKALVSELISERFGTFEHDHANLVLGTDIFAITVEHELRKGDSKKRYFHLCFSPQKMASEREALNISLDKMEAELHKFEKRECIIEGDYAKYFNCHYQEKNGKQIFLFAQRNNEAINKAYREFGYFCLISSDKMTAAEAYSLYQGRDASEKLFRAQKTFPGARSMRAHSNEAVSAKIFIEFLALIIRNRFYNLLKDEMRRLNIRRNYMTVPAAIRELEKIEMTRRSGSIYKMDYALTKNQKSVLQCFGLSKDEIIQKTQEIAVVLSKTNDVIPAREEE